MKPDSFMRSLLIVTLILVCLTSSYGQKTLKIDKLPVLKPPTSKDTILLAEDCRKRRELLSNYLGDGIIVINNNEKTEDNFFYLTGWSNKPASCIIEINGHENFDLFIPEQNPQTIIWNGKQAGHEEAKSFGANSLNFFDFKKQLKNLLKSDKKLFLLSQDNVLKESIKGLLHSKADSDKIVYIDTFIHELRVIKSDYEIHKIKKAIGVTEKALYNSIVTAKPNIYEYEIAALFNFEYTRNGLKESFPSICGSGINSTALHYEVNNKLMKSGEVLLMDVGAECNGYAADITRTIPVNGKFTKNQLDLYKLVLKAQEEGIKVMKPGYKVMDFNTKCVEVIRRGLYQLGFITDTTKSWQIDIFILYQAGHYLGLYVHDVGKYTINSRNDKRGRDLMPGMVLTIEPGIYINPQMLNFIYQVYGSTIPKTELDEYVTKVSPIFEKYANIGIRIEDDILITNTGNEILSGKIPKQPEEIERLMHKK